MQPDSNADRSWSAPVVVLALMVVCCGAYVAWGLPIMGACGGDGGSPYARPGSHLADVCDRHATWTPWLLLGPVGLLVAGCVAGKAVRHWWPAALGLLSAFVLMLVPFFLIWAADGPSQRM
jgi:hypothetical protein